MCLAICLPKGRKTFLQNWTFIMTERKLLSYQQTWVWSLADGEIYHEDKPHNLLEAFPLREMCLSFPAMESAYLSKL